MVKVQICVQLLIWPFCLNWSTKSTSFPWSDVSFYFHVILSTVKRPSFILSVARAISLTRGTVFVPESRKTLQIWGSMIIIKVRLLIILIFGLTYCYILLLTILEHLVLESKGFIFKVTRSPVKSQCQLVGLGTHWY